MIYQFGDKANLSSTNTQSRGALYALFELAYTASSRRRTSELKPPNTEYTTMSAAIDGQQFRQLMGRYPTGVAVITAQDSAGNLHGLTVGSFTSISLEPCLVGFFPGVESASWNAMKGVKRFAVSVLSAEQQAICGAFARSGEDKFAGTPHTISELGNPLLDGAILTIECTLHSVVPAGDHLLVMGEVERIAAGDDNAPMIFCQGGYPQLQR